MTIIIFHYFNSKILKIKIKQTKYKSDIIQNSKKSFHKIINNVTKLSYQFKNKDNLMHFNIIIIKCPKFVKIKGLNILNIYIKKQKLSFKNFKFFNIETLKF